MERFSTKATVYLLPILGDSIDTYGDFLGVFVGFEKREVGEHLYVLYENDDLSPTRKSLLESSEYFYEYLPVSETLTMVDFKIRANCNKEIIRLFLKGKYSNFPKEYKHHIIKFHKWNYNSAVNSILNKDSKLKFHLEGVVGEALPIDAELTSIPNLEVETYYPGQIPTVYYLNLSK